MVDLRLILYLLIGAGLGAGLGYFGKCASGTCPLTSTWWRGALYGAVFAFFVYFAVGRTSTAAMNESTPNVKLLRESDFDKDVIQSPRPVVADFYATWCEPCQILSPRLDALAASFTNRINFFKVNGDQSPALMQRFDIEGIPTLLFFKDGKVVDSIVGLPGVDELKARLEAFAGNTDQKPPLRGP